MFVFKKVGDIFCICRNHTCLSRYWHILKDKKIKHFAVLGCVLYGTPCNLIYKDEMVFCSFLFICLFVSIFFVPYTNPHFWTDINRTLHTSPSSSVEVRRVCMDPQYLTLFDLFCQEPVQNRGHNMAAGPRVIATALYSWSSRRHLRQESSATVLYPWCSRRHLRDEVSCAVRNA
jgi:hypothetical protein